MDANRIKSLEAALEVQKRQYRDLEEKMRAMQTTNEQLHMEKAAANRAKHSLTEEVSRKAKLEERIGSMTGELSSLRGQLAAEQRRVAQLEADRDAVLSKANQSVKVWKDAEGNWEKANNELAADLEAAQSRIADLQYANSQLQARCDERESKTLALTAQLERTQGIATRRENEVIDERRQLDELRMVERDLQDRILSLNDAAVKQSSLLSTMQQERLTLERTVTTHTGTIERMQTMLSQTQSKCDGLRVELDQVRLAKVSADKALSLEQQAHGATTTELEAVREEVTSLRLDRDRLSGHVQSLHEIISQMREQHDLHSQQLGASIRSRDEDWASRYERLAHEAEGLRDRWAEGQVELDAARGECERSHLEACALQDAQALLEERLLLVTEDAEERISETNRRYSDVTAQLADARALISSMESCVGISDSHRESLEAEVRNAMQHKGALLHQWNREVRYVDVFLDGIESFVAMKEDVFAKEICASLATQMKMQADIVVLQSQYADASQRCAELSDECLRINASSLAVQSEATATIEALQRAQAADASTISLQRQEMERLRREQRSCSSERESTAVLQLKLQQVEDAAQRQTHAAEKRIQELKQQVDICEARLREATAASAELSSKKAEIRSQVQQVADALRERDAQRTRCVDLQRRIDDAESQLSAMKAMRDGATSRKEAYKTALAEIKDIREREKTARDEEQRQSAAEVDRWHDAFKVQKDICSKVIAAIKKHGLTLEELVGNSEADCFRSAIEAARKAEDERTSQPRGPHQRGSANTRVGVGQKRDRSPAIITTPTARQPTS